MSGGPADSAPPVREGGWTAWRDHDGTGCPLPAGTVVEVKAELEPGIFKITIGTLTADEPSWDWSNWQRPAGGPGCRWARVIRYRWKRPDALERLRQIAAAPPVLRTEEKAAPFLPVEELVE